MIAPRRARLLASMQVWLLLILVLVVLCGQYLTKAQSPTVRGYVFLQAARIACATCLSLIPGLCCAAAATLVSARAVVAIVSGAVWSVTLFCVYVDTRIYRLFHYHFNGLVWNVLTTPGADEAVSLSPRELTIISLVFVSLVPLIASAYSLLYRRNASNLETDRRLSSRPLLAWKLVLLPSMILTASLYAWADFACDPHVMAFSRVFPVYPRLTVKRFAHRWLGLVSTPRAEVGVPAGGISLDYPKVPISIAPSAAAPNVLVIVVDSLRADMLDADVMPRTQALAHRGRVFRDHLSGGNSTRFGLFSLLYGLHGSYWKPVYDEHRSPVLVDCLLERGYEFRVLTSASMDFPELRATAWVRLGDAVEDRLPAVHPGARDEGVVRRFEQWLGDRRASRPFFAFLLLDAPHQIYRFPSDCARFTPYVDEVVYSRIDDEAPTELRVGLWNRYRNAVHYADQTIGRLVDAVEASGLADNTIVVVTGDHGEAFFENGVWGHTSDFTRSQVQVPLVLLGPGVPHGVEERPTCHIDVAATVLELLGLDPVVRSQWTLGESLLDPPARRTRIVAGWDSLGVHVDDVILEVPMASHRGGGIAVYDADWRRVHEDRVVLQRQGKALGVLASECRRFLR